VLKPVLDAPHQLPPDVAGFTGRDMELGKLRALVAERAAGTVVISAIAGTAGIGKTALAVHLAHELADDFPDVYLYVNLHGYEPAQRLAPTQVLDRFLRALGVLELARSASLAGGPGQRLLGGAGPPTAAGQPGLPGARHEP